jgi:hypothetical protein
MLEAYLREMDQQPANPSDDELVTVAQARAIAQRDYEQRHQADRAKAAQALSKVQFERMRDDFSHKVDTTLGDLRSSHKELQEIDGIDTLLLNDIAPDLVARIKEDPSTAVPFEDVQAMLKEAASTRATKERERLDKHAKMAVARAAKAKPKVQPVPAGGQTATSGPSKPKQFKLGTRDLMEQAMADYRHIVGQTK